MESLPPNEPATEAEAARLAACKQLSIELAAAWSIASGLAESLMDMSADEKRIVDARRWAVACKLLRAADHEFGKAVR